MIASVRQQRLRARGMTIMEMMIVMIIIGLVMTGVALGLGSLTRQKLKSSAVRVAAAVRMAYSRSATTGNTVRIVFDIDGRALWGEEAEGGRVLLSRDDDENLDGEDEDEDGSSNASSATTQADSLAGLLGSDPSQLLSAARGAAEADMGSDTNFDMIEQLGALGSKSMADMETPRYRVPSFSALPNRLGKRTILEDDVMFVSVLTSHREHPAEEGKAALYFFPGGITELAVIQLRDSAGYVNSVEVHPLTGRCTIHDVPYEPPTDLDDLHEAREAW